jgi:hypothetical protein
LALFDEKEQKEITKKLVRLMADEGVGNSHVPCPKRIRDSALGPYNCPERIERCKAYLRRLDGGALGVPSAGSLGG